MRVFNETLHLTCLRNPQRVFKTLSFVLNPRTLSEGFTQTFSSEGFEDVARQHKPSCHKRNFEKPSDLTIKPSEGFEKPRAFK